MSEKTGISWTDATFNPWWGCTKVSPACDHCYAERDAHRYQPGKVLWGVGSDRRTFGEKHWNEPLRWANTLPEKLGRRPRVFCASMADVFDKDAPEGARHQLLNLIADTPELDWLLLTKRIGNARAMLDEFMQSDGHRGERWEGWPNVWLGATVVNQEEFDRDVPKLDATPAAVRFLSIEPMLGPIVDSDGWLWGIGGRNGLDWVIAGGESGPKARPMHPDWVRSLRDQCAAAGVPFHFKQWGEFCPGDASPAATGDSLYYHLEGNRYCVVGVKGDTHSADAEQVSHPSEPMYRVGTKAAGRLLDGIEHNGFPS